MLLAANGQAAASTLTSSLGRRHFTPFGRGGRLTYSAEAYRGSRLASVGRTHEKNTWHHVGRNHGDRV